MANILSLFCLSFGCLVFVVTSLDLACLACAELEVPVACPNGRPRPPGFVFLECGLL